MPERCMTSPPWWASELMPLDCTLLPGDLLYFPNGWWHATINVGTTVFMCAAINLGPLAPASERHTPPSLQPKLHRVLLSARRPHVARRSIFL